MKRLLALLVILALLLPQGSFAASNKLRVYYEGKEIKYTVKTGMPYEYNGWLMVPIKQTCAAGKIKYTENSKSKQLTMDYRNQRFVGKVGTVVASKDGNAYELWVKPVTKNKITYMALSDLSGIFELGMYTVIADKTGTQVYLSDYVPSNDEPIDEVVVTSPNTEIEEVVKTPSSSNTATTPVVEKLTPSAASDNGYVPRIMTPTNPPSKPNGEKMKATTPYGDVVVDYDNCMFINGKFRLCLNNIVDEKTPGSHPDAMQYFMPSEILYLKSTKSIWFMGSSLERFYPNQEPFKDTLKYMGRPHTIVGEFSFETDSVTIAYELPGDPLYAAPYDTKFYVDENQKTETFDWSLWAIQPKSSSTSEPHLRWLAVQTPLDPNVSNAASLRDTAGKTTIQIYQWDLENKKITPYLYVTTYAFEKAARDLNTGKAKYDSFIFNPAGLHIQSEADGTVSIVNLRDENTGIAMQFDLSQYGNPKFIQMLWK